MVGVLPIDLLRYSSALVERRKGLIHSSHPHTIVCVRTPYYEHATCPRSLFGGNGTTTMCSSFYTLHSFAGKWWCVEDTLHQVSTGSRRSSFRRLLHVLPSYDIAVNMRSFCQRTLPQSDGSSLYYMCYRLEETAEQIPNPCPL